MQETLRKSPAKLRVYGVCSVMSKHFICRKGIRFGHSQEERKASDLPLVCLHVVVKGRQIVAMIIRNIDGTFEIDVSLHRTLTHLYSSRTRRKGVVVASPSPRCQRSVESFRYLAS